jgi:putative membrane protein
VPILAALDHPWRWQPHPEVWVLVVSLAALYTYAVRVIGPKTVPAGEPVLTRRQLGAFVGAVSILWFASDWPLHDIGEDYLYSAHMVQHLLFSMVMAPLFLLATPRWLADTVLGEGRVRSVVRSVCRPVPATLLFNSMLVFIHWPALVNNSVRLAPLHYGVHTLVVLTSLVMWTPICGPYKEWRLSAPTQMAYLFVNSVVPTAPSAWLILAEHPVYHVYVRPYRMWGLSVTDDQQIAGVIMKLGSSAYLWTIITVKFFMWARDHERAERANRSVSEGDVLTWQDVEAAFESSPAVPEPTDRTRPAP